MMTLGSPASVVAAIREDAEAEATRINETTSNELSAIRAEAASVSVAIVDREERLTAARRENDERIARQEWEGRRAMIEQREEWIRAVVATAQERWSSDDPEKLNALIREARSRLPAGEVDIAIDPRGGCVVTAGDVSFDNSYDARSRRLEPEWRGALSGIYTP